MRRACILCAAAAALSGCGGRYVLTVPDQVASAGKGVAVVVRLQRTDVFGLPLAVKGAALRFRIADGPERAAFTDALGYAGAAVPVPAKPGRYPLSVAHTDREGQEVFAQAPVYVWQAGSAVVAVDFDALPGPGTQQGKAASEATRRLAGRAGIIYMTRTPPEGHRRLHERLRSGGYPDGVVLLWRRKSWHIARKGRYRIPQVVVETRLVSQLARLRRDLPALEVGVSSSVLAAKAFAEADLRCVMVGPADAGGADVTRRADWAELRDKGL